MDFSGAIGKTIGAPGKMLKGDFSGGAKDMFNPFGIGEDKSKAIDTSPLDFYKNVNNYPTFQSGYQKTAHAPGESSPWLDMSQKSLANDYQNQRQGLAQQTGAAQSSAWNGLASRGGLSQGAQERTAYDLGNQGMAGQQNLGLANERNKLGLNIQDEETNNANIQSDAGRYQADANARNTHDLGRFQLGGQSAAAEVLGNATAASGGKGGSSFICTELRRHGLMTKKESKAMTSFMLRSIFSCAHFFFWYLRNGQKLVDLANASNIDWKARKSFFVDDILYTMKTMGINAAQDLYGYQTHALAKEFGMKVPKRAWGHNWFKSIPMLPLVATNKTVRNWIVLKNWRIA